MLPSPCFPNFLARTTFVLVSLSEVKIPGQDAIFGDFVFNSFEYVSEDVRLIQEHITTYFEYIACLLQTHPSCATTY